MLLIGEGFWGTGANAAHINLFLGEKHGPMGTAFAVAAASPGPGHVPFQVVLKPNLPVKPFTLFIAKAVLRDAHHETFTWGPAQAGVAVGMTKALLDDVLPAKAEGDWLAIAAVWVDPKADDADLVYENNRHALFLAAERAMMSRWPTRAELARGLPEAGNPFFTPKRG